MGFNIETPFESHETPFESHRIKITTTITPTTNPTAQGRWDPRTPQRHRPRGAACWPSKQLQYIVIVTLIVTVIIIVI